MEKFFETQKKIESDNKKTKINAESGISRKDYYQDIAEKAKEDLAKEAERAGITGEVVRNEKKEIVFNGDFEELDKHLTN